MTSMSTQKACASLSSSSSSSAFQWKFDVFLSFYEEDTRNNFTDHLYSALIQKGIIVYRDNVNPKEGKPIASELMKAIEESKYAIIIFSKNYAFSKWCLNELAKILECKKEKGLKVRPVFYHVNPSDVGNQRETFGKAFLKHEEDRQVSIEQIHKWRTALKEVSKIRGRHLTDSSGSKDIEEITESIFDELNQELSDDYEHLVGINSRMKEMMNLFSTMSDDVRFIGIWGMAGIGKTTLAFAIYYRICHQFEASSFIRDIRETVEKDKQGLVNLQKQLLSETLMVKEVKIWNYQNGIKVIKKRLQNKRVLIVLDDVDKDEQLKALAGRPGWFGPGSRIIITSKDKHLLKRHHLGTTIHKVNGLDNDEALELFSWTVFKQPFPKNEFENLSNGFVKYAKGLPIALKVLSSSLIDQSREIWEDYLHLLEEIPEEAILDKLEISYRGLKDIEQNLFLDIACFFKGEDKNRVEHIEGSGCKMNIKTLKDKSLITILGGKLQMHDLIQEMAWRVVHRESPKEPGTGRRSRLWHYKDVFHVLKENTGTEVVEGMVLNSPPHKENLNDKAFSKMISLRLLKISNVYLPEGLNFLSNKLRILEWHDYPLKSMPNNFQPYNLVELIMPRSHIKQLPEGFGNLAKLRLLDLGDSKDFVKTPNFNEIPILEELIFQGCTSLYELHLPVGALNCLTLLNLKDCKNLKSLPSKINLESLKIFNLSGCSALKKFPDIGINMTSLSELYLDGTAIEELPPSIEHLTGLSLLSLKDCKRLSRFPRVDLPSLRTLILSGCKFQPPKSWLYHGLSVIRAPHVSNYFFPTLGPFNRLVDYLCQFQPPSRGLSVIRAPYVLFTNYFFPTLGPFNQLLPTLSGLNVVSLDLSDCSLLDGALPDDLTCLSSLQSLNLRKNNFTRLPDSMSQLSTLVDLNLNDCSKLQSLPNLPQSIGYVTARRCTSLANYSNQQFIRWTSGERGVAMVDCRGDKSETEFGFDVVDSPWNPIGFDQFFKTVPKIRCQPLSFGLVSDLTEIPEWFSYRSPAGSSVKIPVSSNLCDNNSWSGIAFLAISVPPDISYNKEFLLNIKITCHSDIVGGLESCTRSFPMNSEVCWDSSFAYGTYLPLRKLKANLDEYSFISVSITSNHPHIDFKCGARKVNVEDLTEFGHVIKKNYPHLGSSTEDHPVVSCQSDWKRDLESLLLKLYQGDWAKNHKYDYIIPYITVPAWFRNHRFCSSIRIRLPDHLKCDERWMGIAVCAYYTVDKRLAGSDDQKDLTSFLCFYNSLPSHQIRLTRHKVFQDSKDFFVDSTHRILVYYIPQMSLQLRGCSHCIHIGASFEPKNPGVQVKECGIRLVYEQNVEEFVQTLVQCMLRCPDANHEFFYHNLPSHKNERESCFDNGKDNGCSSSSQRMRQPMPNIAEHCTSPESFSNPQIDVGTSRNFSPSVTGFLIPTRKAQHGSIMSSESSIKACLQKNCEDGEILHGYSAERQIPQWFCNQTNGRAVKLPQPQELCNDPDLMGLALCGLFHFTKHPTAVHENLDSRTFDRLRFQCFLETSSSPMRSVCNGLLSEDNELISLIQRSFIWVLFIPYTAHSHLWSQSTWFNFLFTSNSPDLSVESCGFKIVYRKNMEELTRIMAQYSITSPFDWFLDDIIIDPKEVCYMWDNFPEIFIEATSSSEYLHPQRLFISQGDSSVTAQYSYHEDDPDPDITFRYFHPSTPYDFCFPKRGTLKWFNHQSRRHSISIDITSNLYDDSNWMGLALYASFSIDRNGTNFENMVSISSPHFLYCQFELSSASLDQIHSCRIDDEEKYWLCNQYGFSWISYIPGEAFKDMLNQCDHMKASFVSDLPGVIVQNCGLRLLHKHDELQFERELQYCYTLISQFQDFRRWLLKQEPVHHDVDTISERTETTGMIAKPIQVHMKQLDLDGCFEYFGCFPLVDVLPYFSSRSIEPSVTIYVPKYFYNDIDWMGLVLCANFSIQEHQTAILENPNSTISHHLICLLETDVAGPEHLLIHHTNNEEFMWLDTKGQFLWLSCISRELLPDEFNQCGSIKASIVSDWPGVMVQKCGLSFFHVNDDWFRGMRYYCQKQYLYQNIVNQVTAGKLKMKQDHDDETGPIRTSSSNENQIHHEITRRPIDKGETSEAKDQHCQSNLLDFGHRLVHNFCFDKCEDLGWFSNQSDSPSLTINSIRNLCSDNTWLGFALCAFFELNEDQNSILDILDSETSYNLICHLETNIGSVKPRHIYCPTKKDLMLSQTGGFFWLSYIPRGSLPDWLNHCSLAKFLFATNCPGLTARKCGLLPMYKHTGQKCSHGFTYKLCEKEFKEEILTYLVKSLSDNWKMFWNLTIDNTNKRRQKHDIEARPSTSGSSNEDSYPERRTEHVDPMLKDKGKRVLE